MAYVAVAGPMMNLCLALLSYALFNGAILGESRQASPLGLGVLQLWFFFGMMINLALAVFNLLPVPPLDGGRIAVGFLPLPLARSWARIERYGIFIIFLLLYFGFLDRVLGPAQGILTHMPLVGEPRSGNALMMIMLASKQ